MTDTQLMTSLLCLFSVLILLAIVRAMKARRLVRQGWANLIAHYRVTALPESKIQLTGQHLAVGEQWYRQSSVTLGIGQQGCRSSMSCFPSRC